MIRMCNCCESVENDLDTMGVLVVEMPRQKASCIALERGRMVSVNTSRFDTSAQKCEALMHEESHFEGGYFYKPYSPYVLKEQMEYRANKRMILKRIPQQEIFQQISEGNTELWELAEYFGVSEPFMLRALLYYNEIEKQIGEKER